MSNAQIPQLVNSQPKKKMSSTMFWFLIFGSLFMTFMVLCCSGAGLLAYRASVDASKLASAQVKWKLPKELPLPDELRKELELAGAVTPSTDRPIEMFQKWVEKHEGKPEIDFSRFVKAMEHTGISNDINFASSWLIAQTLSSSDFDLPYINADSRILAADWIVEGQEARILVVTPFSTLEAGAVNAIWLKRQADDWRVYDWKDVVEPLTNAEFMAVYYGEKPRHDGKMSQLMEDITAIFESGKSDETKANAIWQATTTAYVDPLYREYANFHACQYILALNQMDKLEQVVRDLPERSNLSRKFLKLKIAIHKMSQGKITVEDLFLQAKQFVDGTGWYPGLGRTLIEQAKTESDSNFAKSLLIKDLALNDSIYNGLFRNFKSEQDAALIWEHLRRFPNAASKLAKLANAGLTNRLLESLSELSSQDERTRDASTYLTATRAIRSEQWDNALPVLENLYRKELIGDEVELQLKNSYAEALLRSGRLKESMASADDDEEVLSLARDHLLNQYEPYEDWCKKSIASVLQVSAEHPEFDQHPRTILLKAISESIQGNWNACLEPMLKSHHDLSTTDDIKDNVHGKVLGLLADSFEQTQSWVKHRDEFDSADFVLLAFGKKHPMVMFDQDQDPARLEQWREMLAWYRKESSIDDNLWTCYFESKLAYETGHWDEADNWMLKAIEFAKDAKQLETVYNDIGARQFIPFEYSDELGSQRIEMTFRSKRSHEWLTKLIASSKSQSEDADVNENDQPDESLKFLHYTISSFAKQTMTLDQRDHLIASMSESELFEKDALDWMRMDVAKDRLDTEAMWEIALRYVKSVKDDAYSRETWGTDCVLSAIASNEKVPKRIDEAETILGKDWKTEFEMARYLATRDESKCPSREPRYQLWNHALVRNWIVERKLFQNSESPVKASWAPPIHFAGKLLMNRTAAEFEEKQLAAGLTSILRENETLLRIQAESANGGTAHWRVLRDDGILLISLFDRPKGPTSPASEEPFTSIGVSYTNFQSALAIIVIPYSQMHDGPSLLTRTAQELSRSIEAIGYIDEQSGSLLVGGGWREKLKASESVALDPAKPGRTNVNVTQDSSESYRPNYDSIEIGSERKMKLQWGHFTESMPVSILACESTDPYGTCLVKFLNNSVIDPRMERGWITKANSVALLSEP